MRGGAAVRHSGIRNPKCAYCCGILRIVMAIPKVLGFIGVLT
jgi:hypothetical protein